MSHEGRDRTKTGSLIGRTVCIVGRTGHAASGALCGTFFAAQLAKAGAALFNSVEFALSMILIGAVGFYLGADIPQATPNGVVGHTKADSVELFSAMGTFLAAIAALTSLFAIVFDEDPTSVWELVVSSWWTLGVVMQIGAGLTGRMRLARRDTK